MPSLSALSWPPPRNWQDFEDLCCDLWSRLWNDPDTRKNGRSGQVQKGVDIYGRQGSGWIGLQCKRNDELTIKSIEEAVEQARQFKPQLSRFLIATTAPRDSRIQGAIRHIDEAERLAGSFTVTVAFWEDIVLKFDDFPDLAQKYYPDVFPRLRIASESITKGLFRLFQNRSMTPKGTREDFHENIKMHLIEVLNWSRQFSFYGMNRGEEVDDSTISLDLDTIPRRFQGTAGGVSEKIHESTLLEERSNYVLLGSPGSGKTTTLKRLARMILLAPPGTTHEWQYPVIVRLVNVDNRLSLYQMIASAVGIPYDTRLTKMPEEYGSVNSRRRNDAYEYYVSETPLEFIIPEILDSIKAILMLDGLDEVALERRDDIEREIEALTLRLARSKIILTCRSGDYNRPLGNFNLVEICPLDLRQIEELCSKWLRQPQEFVRALSTLPYYDLASRPLFLCHLIVNFRYSGCLPDQPADVYRKTVRLALEKWDAERRIQRASKYAQFDPDRKLEFLAALAYHLTYETKVKNFSTQMLEKSYNAMCYDFGLPPSEAEQVAQEIETHTGLILEAKGVYEFSHLSLQEFLCAHYLVREPFAEFMIDYLQQYPSPVAVAVSLSANPSNWFANLILTRNERKTVDGTTLPNLLSRLVQEQPHFSRSENLGFAIIKLAFDFSDLIESCIGSLLALSVVQDSFVAALSYYEVEAREDIHFHLADSFASKYNLPIPSDGVLSSTSFKYILDKCSLQVEHISLGEKSLLLFRRPTGDLI